MSDPIDVPPGAYDYPIPVNREALHRVNRDWQPKPDMRGAYRVCDDPPPQVLATMQATAYRRRPRRLRTRLRQALAWFLGVRHRRSLEEITSITIDVPFGSLGMGEPPAGGIHAPIDAEEAHDRAVFRELVAEAPAEVRARAERRDTMRREMLAGGLWRTPLAKAIAAETAYHPRELVEAGTYDRRRTTAPLHPKDQDELERLRKLEGDGVDTVKDGLA